MMMLPGHDSFRVWWSREAHRQEVPDPPSAQARGMLLAECAALLASITLRSRIAPVIMSTYYVPAMCAAL